MVTRDLNYLSIPNSTIFSGLIINYSRERLRRVTFTVPVDYFNDLEQVEKMCTHLVVLKRGSVVAAGPIGEMQAGFNEQSLAAGFMQLTEQVDAERIAENIAAAALAPAR